MFLLKTLVLFLGFVLLEIHATGDLLFCYLLIHQKFQNKLSLKDPDSKNVIQSPKTVNVLHVDAENGRDWKDGATEATALKTLQRAAKVVKDKTKILVKNGIYRNQHFYNGLNNPVVMSINNKKNIILTNYPGHR